MRRRDRVLARLLAVIVLCLPFGAAAHVPQLSSSDLTVNDDGVDAEVRVNAVDLEAALGQAPGTDAIATYVARHAVVTREGESCHTLTKGVRPDGDQFVVTLRWTCPGDGEIGYHVDLFREVEPKSRHIVMTPDGQAMLDAAEHRLTLRHAEPMSVGTVALRYVYAGVEHIFIGYDHIAFLIAAVAWARRAWPVVKLVTAFTIAHSITLSLAALDIVVVSDEVIEPLIAASIIYVAVENFFIRDVGKRWRITGLFGLIHGFGFAGALREFGLPHDALLVALGTFNIGVEIGQVVIVCIAVPLLVLADHAFAGSAAIARRPETVYAVSTVILALGSYWLIERTLLG